MGIIGKELEQFTLEDVKNRELILKMLRYEDKIYRGEYGQSIYQSIYNKLLDPQLAIQRRVLFEFGFNSDDKSLRNYRDIFKYYYQNATNFDKEVMESVLYFRENRCLYYQTKKINLGDTYPDCEVYNLDGKTKTNLYKEMENYRAVVIGAFSTS